MLLLVRISWLPRDINCLQVDSGCVCRFFHCLKCLPRDRQKSVKKPIMYHHFSVTVIIRPPVLAWVFISKPLPILYNLSHLNRFNLTFKSNGMLVCDNSCESYLVTPSCGPAGFVSFPNFMIIFCLVIVLSCGNDHNILFVTFYLSFSVSE